MQVMEFYIFKHFMPKCKVMLSHSFKFNLLMKCIVSDCSIRVGMTALLEYINLHNKGSVNPYINANFINCQSGVLCFTLLLTHFVLSNTLYLA